MKLYFCGGAGEVTGVKYLLEVKISKTKIIRVLIDCGILQGGFQEFEQNSKDFPFNPQNVDYLIVTHAHIDHVGLIPKLYRDGFRGKIFCTEPTKDLMGLVLYDSQQLLEKESRKRNEELLYSQRDVDGALKLVQTVKYGTKKKIAENVWFKLNDAGHMLGSAIIEFWAEKKKIVFSGDLGNAPSPLLNPPKQIKDADYILVESTYGDRIHEDQNERRKMLESIIEETYKNKGVLMIPAFAVERTQELLYEFNELINNCRVPQMPIFIDSPLAIKATQIYKSYPEYFNKEAKKLILSGDDLFKFPGLKYTQEVDESKAINIVSSPKIIIAGSGMSTGGRIIFHEKLYLPDSRNCLLITNFQVKGSLGRQLLEGAKEVNLLDEVVPVRAKIVKIDGYSSHADRKAIFHWLERFNKPVQHIWAVQGEIKAAESLAQLIKDHLGIPASVPQIGDIVEL